jgi:cobaltochelatase CobN
VFVTNMTNPKRPIRKPWKRIWPGDEGRYLNPAWIKAMMKEGYAGARMIDKVTEHLWGWQVTVPEG